MYSAILLLSGVAAEAYEAGFERPLRQGRRLAGGEATRSPAVLEDINLMSRITVSQVSSLRERFADSKAINEDSRNPEFGEGGAERIK